MGVAEQEKPVWVLKNVYCKGMNVANSKLQESSNSGSMVVDEILDNTWVGNSRSGDDSRLTSESCESIRGVTNQPDGDVYTT